MPRISLAKHGHGKLLAASAVRLLMLALAQFTDPKARELLADGLGKIVDAIRAEPDPAADAPRRHWMEGADA